jgi:hypothetical protein
MADRTASGAEQSPESRLLGASFTRRLDFWVPPGEERTLDLDDAIGMLDALLTPIIRREIRAAARAEARRQAREPKP